MKKIIRALFTLSACAALSGCAVCMALDQPHKKDLEIARPSIERGMVIGELGAPTNTRRDPATGETVDLIKFKQGYPGWARGLRAGGHLIGDLATICLWELAGTPIELSFNGDDMIYEIRSAPDGTVTGVKVIKG